jgi:hypothetical protein
MVIFPAEVSLTPATRVKAALALTVRESVEFRTRLEFMVHLPEALSHDPRRLEQIAATLGSAESRT